MLGFVLVLAASSPQTPAEDAEDFVAPRPPLSPWQRQHRRLQIQTGVSWGFVGVGLVGTAGALGSLLSCRRGDFCEPIGELVAVPMFAVLTAAALVPAIIYTDRLVEHRRRRPAARLKFSPVGLVFSF